MILLQIGPEGSGVRAGGGAEFVLVDIGVIQIVVV